MTDTTNLTVAEATLDDTEAVAALMNVQNQFHAELVPHIIKRVQYKPILDWCAEKIADPTTTIYLAKSVDGRTLGTLFLSQKLYPDSNIHHPVHLGFVDELVVAEDVRGRGVGKALLHAAQAYVKTHKLAGLSLNVWGRNQNAIKAYEAVGFETVYQRMTWVVD